MVDVYAHDEFNWLRRQVLHARWAGVRRGAGAARMRRWPKIVGVDHERRSWPRRKVWHLVERFHEAPAGG